MIEYKRNFFNTEDLKYLFDIKIDGITFNDFINIFSIKYELWANGLISYAICNNEDSWITTGICKTISVYRYLR